MTSLKNTTTLNWRTLTAAILFGIALSACGGGGGDSASEGNTDGNDDGGFTGDDDVQETLDRLNVNTENTPRINATGEALPEDYAPLGSKTTLLKRSELFIAGLNLEGESAPVSLLKYARNNNNGGQMASLTRNLDASWSETEVHTAAGGDVDGDGFDEIIVAWHDPSSMLVRMKIIQDAEEGFVESGESVITDANPTWMTMVTGDFNGNGSDQIALAVADDTAGTVNLYFLSGSFDSTFIVEASRTKTWQATQTVSELGIEMATGRLDRDSGEELVVVINEVYGSGRNQSPGSGISTYYIYDDENAGFSEMANQRISAVIDNTSYLGMVGTVAIGDMDGDGVDEVLIAALDRFSVECDQISSIQFVLDDADEGFSIIDSLYQTVRINSCESSGNSGHTEYLWAGVLKLDGDEPAEFHVNGVVYEDLAESMGVFTEKAQVPARFIFAGSGNNDRALTRRDNTTMVTGDVTSDGRDDIIIYQPKAIKVDTGSNGNVTFDINDRAISVWSFEELPGDTFDVKHVELVESFTQEYRNSPVILLPVNVDNDSMVLQSVTNSHELVFSEPIVHAALAAPPCWDSGVQATDACQTSWGKGSSVGADASISHTVSTKAHVGMSVDFSLPVVGKIAEGEVEATAGVSLTAEASLGYQLSRTHTYTTGSMEDTVIATIIPYDRYTYKVLAHPELPELVGEEIIVSLPRRPRTLQIERQFYNQSIVGDGVRVDSSVFSHTIGNPKSYPSRPNSGFGNVSFGPFDVGYSGGSQTAEISEELVGGFSTTVAVSYEATAKLTAGKQMRGVSVGSETSATIGFSVGSSVVFTGTVGDISPTEATNADLDYSFGIHAYTQSTGSQNRPFQVINYWVE